MAAFSLPHYKMYRAGKTVTFLSFNFFTKFFGEVNLDLWTTYFINPESFTHIGSAMLKLIESEP